MKNAIKKLQKVLFFVLCSGILSATNYYISSSTGNDSNTGKSPGAAWKTLDKLHANWNIITAGDSILFKRGDMFTQATISDRIGMLRIPNKKSGTASAYIVIGAYGTGARPIISGENISGYHQVLRTGAFKYFIIQDLEIRGEILFRPVDDMTMGIQHFKFLRNKLIGGYDKGSQARFGMYNPIQPSKVPVPNTFAPNHYMEIGYNEFYNTEGEDCINITAPGDYLWVHHNVWKNISEEALDVAGGKGHIIEYNFISGATVNGMKFHSQGSHQTDIIVRGNVIINVGTGTPATALVVQNISHSKIYNNTCASMYSLYIGNRDRTAPEAYYDTFVGNEVFNNIFAGTVQVCGSWKNADMGNGYIWYNAPVDNIWYDNNFHNNIYWKPNVSSNVIRFWENPPYPNEKALVNDARTVVATNQTAFNTQWKNKSNATERMADPLFVNGTYSDAYTYGDFQVKSNSPAVNGGVAVEGYNTDFNGNTIPANAVTIGAFQYNGVDLTPPQVLSALASSANSISVTFSEKITQASAQNISNYSLSGGITVNSASLSSNETSAVLSTSALPSGTAVTLTVNGIKDLAGNTISSNNSASFTYTNPSADVTAPSLQSASLENVSQLKITFSEPVTSVSAGNASNYSINNGITVSSVSVVNSTEVVLNTSNHTDGQYIVTVSGISDAAGNIMSSATKQYTYSVDPGGSSGSTGENTINNPGFESGNKTGWGESNGLGDAVYTFSVNSSSPISGSYDAVLNITTAGTNNTRPMLYANLNQATVAGKSYVLKFKTKVISGSPKIKYYNAGTGLKAFSGTLSGTQNWEIAVDNVTNAISYVYFYFDGTSTGSLSIDEVNFSEKVASISLAGLKVYLQGAYVADTMSTTLKKNNVIPSVQPYSDPVNNYKGTETISTSDANIVDWVLVELRSGVEANTRVARKAALLYKDGLVKNSDGTNLSFANVNAGNYYVIVKHRNHIGIMSSQLVALSSSGGSYDFTTGSEKAYGTSAQAQLKTGLFGMYSGDGDKNGLVNVLDFSFVGQNIFKTGYNSGDYDLNNVINVIDYKQTSSALFKSVQFPQ